MARGDKTQTAVFAVGLLFVLMFVVVGLYYQGELQRQACESEQVSLLHPLHDEVGRVSPVTAPETKYDRKHFKHWVDADGDGQNTRAEVLYSESLEPARPFTDRGGKRRLKGSWACPYTGETFHNARDLDVDHLVPLKEAWLSGAYDWDDETREEYANYLGDYDHLIAVKAGANRSKGAKDPCYWLPDQDSCRYAIAWVRVKRNPKWMLEIDEGEYECLMNAIASCPPQYPDK